MRILAILSKRNLIFLLFILNVYAVKAQNVSYYALTKTSRNGAISTNVSGGQFIAFMGDICYESNKKGIGVGHGTLKLNTSYSNSDYKVYMGSSYWGQNATFKFKTDMSVLNVVLENGDVYVYKKQTAPPSATTCSLIREKVQAAVVALIHPPLQPIRTTIPPITIPVAITTVATPVVIAIPIGIIITNSVENVRSVMAKGALFETALFPYTAMTVA